MERKIIFGLLVLFVVLWHSLFSSMFDADAYGSTINGCNSTAYFLQPGSRCLFNCPSGGGDSLLHGNNEIVVIVRDDDNQPIADIRAVDFWLIGCSDLCLCGGSNSCKADSATNDAGRTTISERVAAGGCDTGVIVVAQGVIIGCPPICLAIDVRGADVDCSLKVDIVDFSTFGQQFPSPPRPFDPCLDFDCDGDIDIVDFSMFAFHWQCKCPAIP